MASGGKGSTRTAQWTSSERVMKGRKMTAPVRILAGVLGVSAVLVSSCATRKGTRTPARGFMRQSPPEGTKADGLPGFDDAVADSLTGFGDTQGASGWSARAPFSRAIIPGYV